MTPRHSFAFSCVWKLSNYDQLTPVLNVPNNIGG
jgi:hypothetical protein